MEWGDGDGGGEKGGMREWGALKGIEGRPREAGGMAGGRSKERGARQLR